MTDVIKQAREILKRENTSDIAARLHINAGGISSLKTGRRNLTENMAARIVEAYDGKPAKPAKKSPPKKPKTKKPAAKKGKGEEANQTKSIPVDDYIGTLERLQGLEAIVKMAEEAVSKVMKETTIPALNEQIPPMVEKLVDKRIEALGLMPGYREDVITLDERIDKAIRRILDAKEIIPAEVEPISEPMVEEVGPSEMYSGRAALETMMAMEEAEKKRPWWRRSKK